jgi:hypothetical protein
MKPIRLVATAFAAAVTVTQGLAAPINVVAPGSLTGTQLATFDDVAGGVPPGTNYDSIFTSGGVSFAERFTGQANTPSGGFDVLSGTPSGPLSLAIGATNQNLNVVVNNGSQVLSGLGPVGFPAFDAIGEGSFAALFTTDQSEFGFDLIGGNLEAANGAILNFFRRDGSLIDTVTLNNLSDKSYGFKRDGGVFDIAGVSVHNNDLAGIGVDNVRFDVRSGGNVPEPASIALVGMALLGLAATYRRKS